MPTAFTETLIIVVTPAAKDTANQYAAVADPTSTGLTFDRARLVRPPDLTTIAGYAANWVMTPDQRARLVTEFGRDAVNFKIYAKGDNVQSNRTYWMFEAAEGTGWTYAEVLAALNMRPYSAPLPG